uniref:Transmembrane protein n=1 Tax=Davidia involucrata TaxID=16924 RepID=A0A5B6ZEI9_DAVIN
MDSYKLIIRGFGEILRNSLKIFFKSGRLMPSIASVYLLLSTLFFLSNTFSITPLISDLIIKGTLLPTETPNGSDFAKLLSGIKEDIRIFIGVESAFFLAGSIVSLFSNTAIILVSAKSLCGKNLSLKELLSGVVRSWKRLFITSFYTALLGIGYTYFVTALLFTVFVIAGFSVASILPIFIVLGIIALILYLYLINVWYLALVISVTEENCYGIEALGKAGVLVKGHRLHGFALNFLYMLLFFIVYPGFHMIKVKQSPGTPMVNGLFSINSICLVNMFMFIAYTVLYFQCKKTHGEEIELQDSIEYSKIPTKPLAQDIP